MIRLISAVFVSALASLSLLAASCVGDISPDPEIDLPDSITLSGDTSIRGYVDGVSGSSQGRVLRGWACLMGHNGSIQVHLYVGGPYGTGVFAASMLANQPTESAVNAVCSTSQTAHRFEFDLSNLIPEESGQSLWVHAIHPSGAGPNPVIPASGNHLVPTVTIKGHIDGVSKTPEGTFLLGWACLTDHPDSIDVHLYVGGPWSVGQFAASAQADRPTEPAVNAVCHTSGTPHRFQFRLDSLIPGHSGQSLWIHAIHPSGAGPNPVISNSGNHVVPFDGEAIEVARWRTVEIELTASQSYTNPFLDVELTAVFTHASGATISRPGFWNGGNAFVVRFAPTETGLWTYQTHASNPADAGLHGQGGAVHCVPYTGTLPLYQHGFLKISSNGRFLQHHDDRPFFYLGDTHWFMEYEDFDSQFVPMVDRRRNQGYTVYQSHPTRGTLSNPGATLIDLAKYQNLDRYFAYIANAGLVHAFGLCCHSAIDYFTPEGAARIARYMHARYGAYPVIFFTSQEVDLWDNADKWKVAFDAWNEIDAYDHPSSCHVIGSTSGEPKLWASDPGHDLFFLQAGHGRLHSIAHYQSYWSYNSPTKPFIESEANYEEILLAGDNHADRVRQAAYKAIQTGASGFGYGANGLWNNCFSDSDCSCCEDRGIDPWYAAIHFPAGAQMRHLKAFYEILPWWNLWPRFIDSSWGSFSDPERSVLKSYNSDHYVVYFYGASSAGTLKRMQGSYSAYWYSPRTGQWLLISDAITPSGGSWQVPAKPDAQDWVLLATRHGANEIRHRTVTASASGPGVIHPQGRRLLSRQAPARFQLVADAGFQVADVQVDGHSRGPGSEVVIAADNHDHSILALFTGSGVPALSAEWRLDGVMEDVALDTAAENDGQFLGAAWVDPQGVRGACARLDGESASVRIGDRPALEGMQAMTVSVWINLDTLPSQNTTPLCKERAYRWTIGANGSAHFVLATANAAWYGPGTVASLGSQALSPGTWYHLAATYDGNRVRTYLNGQLGGTSSTGISGEIVNTHADLSLGGACASNIDHLDGRIDEVRIYGRALTAGEISALHASYLDAP